VNSLLLSLLFMLKGSDCVSKSWPATGLIFTFKTMYEYGAPRWNCIYGRKQTTKRETCPIVTFHHKLTKARTRASTVIGQRLIACALGLPSILSRPSGQQDTSFNWVNKTTALNENNAAQFGFAGSIVCWSR
jgi:hypothetical protein